MKRNIFVWITTAGIATLVWVAIPSRPLQTATRDSKPAATADRPQATETGLASFYNLPSKTASGEMFNANKMTAAHRKLPLNTRVRVKHLDTGKSVVVRINDRGPHVAGRIIDLSVKAAEMIGLKEQGVGRVEVTPEKTADVVDLGLAYTFPASDPPSYMASTAVAGMPSRHGHTLTEQKKHEAGAACADGMLDEELKETLRNKITGG